MKGKLFLATLLAAFTLESQAYTQKGQAYTYGPYLECQYNTLTTCFTSSGMNPPGPGAFIHIYNVNRSGQDIFGFIKAVPSSGANLEDPKPEDELIWEIEITEDPGEPIEGQGPNN